VNVETGRGHVHGCLARRDGESERSMGSGQWAGCVMSTSGWWGTGVVCLLQATMGRSDPETLPAGHRLSSCLSASTPAAFSWQSDCELSCEVHVYMSNQHGIRA